MVLLVLPMVAPLHLYQGRNKDWKFGERVWEVISKTSGLERAGQSVHRAVRTGSARGAIRSKTFYSKKALDYYLPPHIFQIFLWPWYLKTFSKLNLGYNQLDQLVQTNEESFQLPQGAFTNYVCIYWHLTTYVPPLVCTLYVVNLAFF